MQVCIDELRKISPAAAPFQVVLSSRVTMQGSELHVPAFVFVSEGHIGLMRALAGSVLPWATDAEMPLGLRLTVVRPDLWQLLRTVEVGRSAQAPSHSLRVVPGNAVSAVVLQSPQSLPNIAHKPAGEDAIVLQLQDAYGLPATISPASTLLGVLSKRIDGPVRFPQLSLRLAASSQAAVLEISADQIAAWYIDRKFSTLKLAAATTTRVPLTPVDWRQHAAGMPCNLAVSMQAALPAASALVWGPCPDELGPDMQPQRPAMPSLNTIALMPTDVPAAVAVHCLDNSGVLISPEHTSPHGFERAWRVKSAAGAELQGVLAWCPDL
jgi:hypothetical protein